MVMFSRGMVMGWVVIIGLAGIFAVGCPAQAQATDNQWVCKVVSLQGDVQVHRKGIADWEPLRLSDTLNAGDRVSVKANSRAGLVLRNDAVLRLDQHTTLVFTEIEAESTFLFNLLKGAVNFFSRRPRSLKIFTPFVNGVVEGTEFYVQVDDDQTRIELFEGRIVAENNYGTLQMESGQGVEASAESAPKPRVLVQPRDSVIWAIYYPPILSLEDSALPEVLAPAIAKFKEGRTDEAIADTQRLVEDGAGARIMVYRAGMLLNVGRVIEAQRAIREVLSQNPGNSGALALRAIIAVAQNRKERALEIGEAAVKRDPQSAAAQIALSYARQARFDLSGALAAANTAITHSPENAIAWARLAELHLSTGDLALGEEAANKAALFDTSSAHASTLLGFAYLTQFKIKQAKAAFEQAIMLDSAAPLPRLGLGLAIIRKGDLSQGRGQIEIAASLDPVNALIRSYLGKAYFDEKRGPLDQRQLGISKTLDPKDPTPWFYHAIGKQSLNRPVEALQDLQQSISLNDNRAVYRSQLLLDKDRAARGISLARIYDDLDFKQRALVESTKSLSMDPTNYSAHRFLSDTYVQMPQRQIAQVSERLQAQLLQPINVNPVQPQLSIKGLYRGETTGPGKAAFNEFTPLFERNRSRLTLSGIGGNNDTYGDEVVLSGLADSFSYSLGQFHYQSDGFRDNADVEHDIYNAFTQFALTDNVNIQFEYRRRDTTQGDLRLRLEPDFANFQRRELEQDIYRAGLHLSPSPRSDMIASIFYTDRWEGFVEDIPDVSTVDNSGDREGYNAEVQYLFHKDRFNLIFGGGIYRVDADDLRIFTTPDIILPPPFPPQPGTTDISTDAFRVDSEIVYLYTNLKSSPDLVWTLGLSYEMYEKTDPQFDIDKLNPKVGIHWDITKKVRFRAAFLETIKRQLAVDQTIEPTQVAGFNQFYDDANGTQAELIGAAIDAALGGGFYTGLEFTRRDLSEGSDGEEERYSGYLHWAHHANWSFNLGCQLERDQLFNIELETTSLPLTLSYFAPMGLYTKLGLTFVWQEEGPGTVLRDDFSVVDVELGYRLPKRLGFISVEIANLFDESFRFRDADFKTTDPFNLVQPYQPERAVLVRVVLNF